jgi:hypothetical protein
MVVEGPFGPQVSGGTNLGEDPEDFYLPENIIYYDGEDTSSVLAPIYGVYGFDYGPWINYHRWARSLFCPSYEPEFGVLRWFPSWNMPVLDGTGFFSILGGSVTRNEMVTGLRNLFNNGCDPTGSVYWWPMGLNFKQGLSRCSQGQGVWAWQYLEQWLGVKANVNEKTLTLSPRGLLTEVDWKGLRIGPQRFNLSWCEKPDRMEVKVENLGPERWTILIENRPYLAGVQTAVGSQRLELSRHERETARLESRQKDRPHTSAVDIVKRKEAELLAEDGVVFIRYGTVDPFPDWYELWQEAVLDLRFYLLNASNEDWTEASVILDYPNGWLAKARRSGEWPKPANLLSRAASINLGNVPAWTSKVAPFQLKGPHDYENDHLTAGKSQHFPSEFGPKLRLPTRNVAKPEKTDFLAKLRATRAVGDEIVRELIVPVEILPVSD